MGATSLELGCELPGSSRRWAEIACIVWIVFERYVNYKKKTRKTTKRRGSGRWPWNIADVEKNLECWQLW